MRFLKLFLVVCASLVSTLTHAAGWRMLDIAATPVAEPLKGVIWYPCAQATSDVRMGPYVLSVAKDCPMTGHKLPLVVISHGWGGTFLGHRDAAQTLADAGFVVVAVNHGDSAMNERRNGDLSVLVERPTDVSQVLDFMLGQWPQADWIDAARVGFFGFSRGGYTGLVAMGADPESKVLQGMCERGASRLCASIRDGSRRTLSHDPRIKAAVIVDPLIVPFTPQSLQGMKVPLQIWASARGGDGVTPAGVAALARTLTSTAEFHTVAQAQHFSFLPPCPPELARRAPDICSDEPGFDRAAFHRDFNARILSFLQQHLATGAK